VRRIENRNFVSLNLLILLGIFTSIHEGIASDRIFKVDDGLHRDTVQFVLDAPFEVINGTTNTITGKVEIKGDIASGSFSVPVNTIKTGIEKRDEHLLNDKWLDAAKYPTIKFEFSGVKIPKNVWEGKKASLSANGKWSIHGVTKKETAMVDLQYFAASEATKKRMPGNLFRIKAKTKLKLSDYKIAQSDSKIKGLLGLKVGEVAEVSVDLMGSDK